MANSLVLFRFRFGMHLLLIGLLFGLTSPSATSPVRAAEPTAGSLEARLLAEPIETLARDAETSGDARRGAINFHQTTLGCNRCHVNDGSEGAIGPNLTAWAKPPTTIHLIESLLKPSEKIREGYKSAMVLREDGRQLTGLFVEATDDAVTLKNAETGDPIITPTEDIEFWKKTDESTMPGGLVNRIGTRQQFLDLVAYVREIADGGPDRARSLQPPAALLYVRPVPEYEATIDHAGLIRRLDRDSFKRGQAVYERLCANCHGTHDREGTLPTSRNFLKDPLRNGRDPFAMYQTLTRGFGLMMPQHWMVPQQKYDVVHYLREAYLKPDNPSQYFELTEEYLDSLPTGDSFGPEPSRIDPWSAMDYGPTLMNTIEIGKDGTNIAYKGIAVRLDGGAGGIARGRAWAVYEHDTLRLAGFWTGDGFIDWNGIHFNGRHGVHPRAVGEVHLRNIGPGWANPETGSFTDDARVIGRDDRRYGPLPDSWAKYDGMSHSGGSAILQYRVGDTEILETPGLLEPGTERTPVLTRTFEIGPRVKPLRLSVATGTEASGRLTIADDHVLWGGEAEPEILAPEATPAFDGNRFLEVGDASEIDLSKDFTVTARIHTRNDGVILARTVAGPRWVPGGQVLFVQDGRLCYDIGWVGVVRSDVKIADGRRHDVALTFDADAERATLFVDGREVGSRKLAPENRLDKPILRIGRGAPNFPKQTKFTGEIERVRIFDSVLTADRLKQINRAEVREADGLVAEWMPSETDAEQVVANGVESAAPAHWRKAGNDAPAGLTNRPILAGTAGLEGATWKRDGRRLVLEIPPGQKPIRFVVWATSLDDPAAAHSIVEGVQPEITRGSDLSAMMTGGPSRWPEVLETDAVMGNNTGPFAVDTLTAPETNPWLARVRLTGLDFFEDGDRAAVCAWDGDVWLVENLRSETGRLRWRRIASGLFQPLGVKIVEGQIYITCRDQIVILHDRNDDLETDYYEAFNSDHQVTEHFHEFAMGLQRDTDGNFYYAKSARHALPAVVPHHGTLIRVSRDGSETEILATGFRAANGVCLNDDGSYFVTDQEGHWTPKNRINWVREGGFYGNMLGYHDIEDSSDAAMQPPLCWLTNEFDRSPAELLWVESERWGELNGELLSLSYGYGKIFVIPHERITRNGEPQMQGGAVPLPLPDFPTGLVRGRFHPGDGQLYVCGMFAWAGSRQEPGGFYRVRRTENPLHVPIRFDAAPGRLMLGFTDELDRESVTDPDNFSIETWSLKRTRSYGSKHHEEKRLTVTAAALSDDGKRITLTIPDLTPTMGMAVRWKLKSAAGKPVTGEMHGTVHQLDE